MNDRLSHEVWFPEEAFDAEKTDTNTERTVFTDGIYQKRMYEAHDEITGGHYDYLTVAEEWALSKRIQDGIRAKLQLAEFTDDATASQLLSLIEDGAAARKDLFDANLPFAGFIARQSMNLPDTPKQSNKAAILRQSKRPRAGSNKFGDLKKLRSEHAELDDRMQVVAEAMWTATNMYEPPIDADGFPVPVKFTTYAYPHMYRKLERLQLDEHNKGWSVSTSIHEKVREDQARLSNGIDVRPRHINGDSGVHSGYRPKIVYEGRTTETLDAFSLAAPEETDQNCWEEFLGLEDIVAAPDNTEQAMFDTLFEDQLAKILAELSDREAEIIRLRFGIGGGAPLTLTDTGKVFGISRERVRQIETKVMIKLRRPNVTKRLYSFLEGVEPTDTSTRTLGQLCLGAVNIKTESVKVPGSDGSPPIEESAEARDVCIDTTTKDLTYMQWLEHKRLLEAQQRVNAPVTTAVSEEWDAPVRTRKAPLYVNKEQVSFVNSARLFEGLATENADAFTYDANPSRLRGLATSLRESLDGHAHIDRIAHFFNQIDKIELQIINNLADKAAMYSRDKLVEVFSQIIAEKLQVDDELVLRIPETMDGEINGLLHGMKAGKVTIWGNVGNNLALEAGTKDGLCHIVVEGDAGDYAGARMYGNGYLRVTGDVGQYLGADVKSSTNTIIVEGSSGKGTGYNSSAGTLEVHEEIAALQLARGSKTYVRAGRIKSIR